MNEISVMMLQMIKTGRLLTDPEAPARIRRAHRLIREVLQEAKDHQTQLECWENEGGPVPAKGNSAEKAAARRVQRTLDIPYTLALRQVQEAKTEDIHWGQAADRVLAEQGFE